LRPGIPGVSENIRVRSIVGRFLEHSRLFWFANGGDEEIYLGSADLMERNLDRRVEILMPIRDKQIVEHLREVVIESYLRDTARAYILGEDGSYTKPEAPDDAFDAQEALLRHYTDGRDSA
jgi:polyphosphate kinase